MNLKQLADTLKVIDSHFKYNAIKAINFSLTISKWLYGYYLQEYELAGEDRAIYAEKTREKLSAKLGSLGVPGCSSTQLKVARLFYQKYQRIGLTLSDLLSSPLSNLFPSIGLAVSDQLSPDSLPLLSVDKLLNSLSFSHFIELCKIDNSLKRSFYEVESIRGTWSSRELKRQINSLYYERSILSTDKKKLSDLIQGEKMDYEPKFAIRDPYCFEFLGLKPKEITLESDLADSLMDKLQDFLLELGKGFCFEAKNKRILIGGEYFFIDLVFYHRILKCHVLIELKTTAFTHENIGQLRTYLNYFKRHELQEGDNPPMGILLCTEKNHALVEYALADEKNELFVSKYAVELPTKEAVQEFIELQLKEVR